MEGMTTYGRNRPRPEAPLSEYGVRKQSGITRSKKPEIEAGTIIGNYRFLEIIGFGGFGEVYKAESLEVHREVAIKLYEVRDEDALKAFKRGANLLAQIDHPNIVKLYDFFTTGNYALMVMELLSPNQTLRSIVGDFCGQEKIGDFLKIFRDILDAIRYCHQSRFHDIDGQPKIGIYHGDIKPENIFLHKGQIKIADFMIPNLENILYQGRWEQESFPYYDTRAYGTEMYMSPEQQSGIVNEQTDIYNIGVTAFELLTGFYPYDSEDNYHNNIYYPPTRFCPYTPEWLNETLIKCIVHDKSKRYEQIAEIERDIMINLSNSDSANNVPSSSQININGNVTGSTIIIGNENKVNNSQKK